MEFTQHPMLDKMILFSPQHGEIICSPYTEKEGEPTLFSEPNEHVMSLQAQGSFGTMIFHELKNGNYSIRQNRYMMEEDMTLRLMIDEPSMGLHYAMKNNMRYNMEGFMSGMILKHQYNMIFVPEVQRDYFFNKGEEYVTFSIHFSMDYLQRCYDPLPMLQDFLKKVRRSKSAMISPTHLPATPEIIAIIYHILQCSYDGPLKKMYMETKIYELLLLSLQNIPDFTSKHTKVVLRPIDMQKLHEAREYLVHHMDHPCSLRQLAHNVGLNDFKLKHGFKQVFGNTVFGLLNEERMQRAKMLLLETEMSIYEIAVQTGFKNLSNFTASFKKRFGYPPSSIKQSRV
jgi:AraC family transcriptional regulator, transcriptional activator of the genes for pyochelin and ferripyochelin receptors